MNLLVKFFLSALVAYILSMVLDPHIAIRDYGAAMVFVLVLSLVNIFLKPLLLILTLPITILTLGLFLIVLNVLIVMLAGKITSGIFIQNFWWALVFSFMYSFFTTSISNWGRPRTR